MIASKVFYAALALFAAMSPVVAAPTVDAAVLARYACFIILHLELKCLISLSLRAPEGIEARSCRPYCRVTKKPL